MPSLLPSAHGRLERRSFSFGRSRRMKPACSPSECSRAAAASSSPPVQSTHDAADRPRERVPLRRAQSFERKAPPPLAGAPLRSSLSFGRKPRPRACQPVAPPVGISQMSGDLWKRAGIKYLKRFFFIVAGKLYYRDPSDESNNFFCGQVTGVKLYSTEMLEFSITTETREYSFRAETAGQVELWVETCEALLAGEPMKAKLPRGMPPPLPDRVACPAPLTLPPLPYLQQPPKNSPSPQRERSLHRWASLSTRRRCQSSASSLTNCSAKARAVLRGCCPRHHAPDYSSTSPPRETKFAPPPLLLCSRESELHPLPFPALHSHERRATNPTP